MSKKGKQLLKKSWLPTPDFANQVLELEMKIDTERSVHALKSLLELYSQAIEYFESIGDSRYLYFKDRMKCMLETKEHILDSKPIQRSCTYSSLDSHRKAENLWRSHRSRCQSTARQLQQELQSQSACLEQRLSSRKFKNPALCS